MTLTAHTKVKNSPFGGVLNFGMSGIASLKDKDIQYSYALSTVNGMAHLRNALFELVNDSEYEYHKKDLLKTHDAVIRVMKQLIRDYKVNLATIKSFNVRHVLGDMKYLRKTRRRV